MVHHDDGPLVLRQLKDRRAHGSLALMRGGLLGRLLSLGHDRRGLVQRVGLARGAEMIAHDVRRQGSQPAAEGLGLAQPAQLLPGPDEDILGEVGGEFRVAHEVQHEGVDRALIGAKEPLKCSFVSAPGRVHRMGERPGVVHWLQRYR